MPDTPDSPVDVSQIFDEFLARRRQGESPTLDEYCRRFPGLAEQLRLHVGLYDALGEPKPEHDDSGVRPEVDLSTAPHPGNQTSTDDSPFSYGPSEDGSFRRVPSGDTLRADSPMATGDRPSTPTERYHRLRLHATGGIGRVWLARDGDLGRDVALKELRPEHAEDVKFVARFLQEARITGQLEHPAIIPVYSLVSDRDGRQPQYTMRFVKGHTLSAAARAFHDRRVAERADPIELPTLLNAFVTVCNAVAYAHSRGVIHRDLKGQNVILGEFGEVVVLDWGLAKLVARPEDATRPSTVVLDDISNDGGYTLQGEKLGTPAYMAPEQADGRLDQINFHTDVYGLGAILYEILTAKPPFAGGDTQEVLRKVREVEPALPRLSWPQVPPELEALCLRALVKRPEDRCASAVEMGRHVQRWLGETAERKQADEQRARFFALSLDLMTIVGSDGYYRELNPAWEKIVGWTRAELMAKPWVDFLHPEDVAVTSVAADRLFAGSPLQHLENRFRCKDGSYRWLHWTGQVIAGQPLIYCVGRDITDRKRVEAALREREEALRQLTQELDRFRQRHEGDTPPKPNKSSHA
jgi:PAS domain S-box-containing protein